MRVAIYCRVSTDDKKQDPDNQRRALVPYIESMHYELVAEYIDYESGTKDERKYFKAMLADASRRKFDMVLFWSLDRFTREGALPTLQYLQRLTSYGVGYKSLMEPYLDSCGIFKDAIISILATIAKQESLRMGQRTKEGLAKAKAKGTVLGRKLVRVTKQIDPNKVVEMHKAGQSWRLIGKKYRISYEAARQIALSVNKTPPPPCDEIEAITA